MHILIALLIYPIISLVFVWATRNRQTLRTKAAITITAVSITMLAGYYFGISTINTELDLMLTTAPYLLLCLLLWWAVFYSKKYLKALTLIITIIIIGSGYLLGFIEILWATETPNRVICYEDGHILKLTSLGNALTDHRGVEIEVCKKLTLFPLLEKRLTKRAYSSKYIRYMRTWEVIYNDKDQEFVVCIEEMLDRPALFRYDTIQLKDL